MRAEDAGQALWATTGVFGRNGQKRSKTSCWGQAIAEHQCSGGSLSLVTASHRTSNTPAWRAGAPPAPAPERGVSLQAGSLDLPMVHGSLGLGEGALVGRYI